MSTVTLLSHAFTKLHAALCVYISKDVLLHM